MIIGGLRSCGEALLKHGPQHAGHHEIDVNTLNMNQLHEHGEAISPILKDA